MAKYPAYPLGSTHFLLASLTNNTNAMSEQLAWATGKKGIEDVLLGSESEVLAFHGQLKKSREQSRRAALSASEANERETAAGYLINSALADALFGNREAARKSVLALRPFESRDLQYAKRWCFGWLAKLQSRRHSQTIWPNPSLKTPPFDLTTCPPFVRNSRSTVGTQAAPLRAFRWLLPTNSMIPGGPTVDLVMLPVFMRGRTHLEAHQGNEAAVEFQKILDRPGLLAFSPIRALANLYLARAYATQSHSPAGPEADAARAKARAAYESFLTLWKEADLDVPVLKEAKAEYAKLQ